MDIFDKLIELKSKNNWSNYKIAKESNLPNSTISNIFNRKTLPQIDTLIAICSGFGITISEFFNDEEKYMGLTDSETYILKAWVNLSDEKKNAIKTIIDIFNDNDNDNF